MDFKRANPAAKRTISSRLATFFQRFDQSKSCFNNEYAVSRRRLEEFCPREIAIDFPPHLIEQFPREFHTRINSAPAVQLSALRSQKFGLSSGTGAPNVTIDG
jgi:hypothetical protein